MLQNEESQWRVVKMKGGSPLAHKSVQAWSRKFFNRNWKESLVSREAISFVFPRVQMFPEPKSRETSGLTN